VRKSRKTQLVVIAFPLVGWGSWQALERWNYAKSDSIGRSEIDTRRILHRYESTQDVSEIREWILHGPSEAPGAQMCMTVARWAIEHPRNFVEILESLPKQERERFVEVFAASLNQSSPQKFESAFASTSSPAVQKILKTLAENRPIAWLTPAHP
jgi:hypothetical protein